MTREERNALYWRRNIRVVLVLLVLWAVPSLLFGVLGVEKLNAVTFAGFKLGFWFAQQGSIVVFVGLILFYALYMDRLDREFREENEEEEG